MVTITLTETEANVLADLLEKASDEFSNHGCNDYPAPNNEETRALWKAVMTWGNPTETEEINREHSRKRIYFMDWTLFGYFQSKVESAAGKEAS
jgi:hypothetical protein